MCATPQSRARQILGDDRPRQPSAVAGFVTQGGHDYLYAARVTVGAKVA